MTKFPTRRERPGNHQLVKLVVFRILVLPLAMVIAFAVLSGALASLAGLPGTEVALDFVREVAGPVAVIQAKMLLFVGSIGALCFIVGRYRIEALALYLADKLNGSTLGLSVLWSSMRSGISAPFYLIETGGSRPFNLERPATLAAGFVAGETSQLE